jgi:hypothetical protein
MCEFTVWAKPSKPAPHTPVEQLEASEHLVGVPRQEREQIELALRERMRIADGV